MINYSTDNYRAWSISPDDFPVSGTIEEQIEFIVGYGVLAPSTHNTQPWTVVVTGISATIRPDYTHTLEYADPTHKFLFLSLGAYLQNVRIASRHFGYDIEVNQGNQGIEIVFKSGHAVKQDLFFAMTTRRSDKRAYLDKPVPDQVLEKAKKGVIKGVEIAFITDPSSVAHVRKLHQEVSSKLAANKKFVRELVNWLRPNDTKSFFGMPGFVAGVSDRASRIAPKMLTVLPQIFRKLAANEYKVLSSTPGFGVILTQGDTIDDWIKAGEDYQRACLALEAQGVSTAPLSAMIADPVARKELQGKLSTGLYPQLFFRFGYSIDDQILHTPRKQIVGTDYITRDFSKSSGLQVEHHNTKIRQYSIHFVTMGSGTPIVLLHGANIGWPQWYKNIEALSKVGRVYAIDLPGAGDSTKIDFHSTPIFDEFPEIVDEFILKQKLTDVTLIGSSIGGWIALKLAIAQKPYISRVAVLNPLGLTKHMPMKFRPVSIKALAKLVSITALKPIRSNKNLEMFMNDVFYRKENQTSQEFVDYFYELSKKSHNILFISRLAHYKGMRPELYLGKSLSKITIPILVIWGKEDPLMPFASIQEALEKTKVSKLVVLDEVGHMPPIEAPDIVNSEIVKFIKNVS